MAKWRKNYGNIVGLKIGSYRVVILSDVKILKEAFQNAAFNARPAFKPAIIFSGGSDHGNASPKGNAFYVFANVTLNFQRYAYCYLERFLGRSATIHNQGIK